jgi:hypothetical protein
MQFCIPAATNPPKVTIRKVKSALKSRRLHVKSDFRFSGGKAGVPGGFPQYGAPPPLDTQAGFHSDNFT